MLGLTYPNPANPTTRIGYTVGRIGFIEIRIFSVAGSLVKTLVHRKHGPGRYEALWDGSSDSGEKVASGVYFYQLVAPVEGIRSSRRMVVVR